MQKLGLLFKEASGNLIKENLEGANSVFVVKHARLSSPDLSALRQLLKNTNATMFIVRNSVTRRVLAKTEFEGLSQYIEGSCGLVFAKDEPVSTCRLLYNFSKDHEQLKIEAGLLENKLIKIQDIEAISKLPAKEVLRAQVACALKSTISGFVSVLKQNLRKFVYCVEQIKSKKNTK